MGQVISPSPLFANPASQDVGKVKGANILFNADSTSTTSHVVEVGQTAIVIKAFNLSGSQTISINMIGDDGITTVMTPLVLNGKLVQLSTSNVSLVLDLPGRYTFSLNNGGLGTVSAIILPSGMPYWSYGIAAFTAASS